MMEAYRGRALGELSPHVYAIADMAFRQMQREKKSQSILACPTAQLIEHAAAAGHDRPLHAASTEADGNSVAILLLVLAAIVGLCAPR